MKERYKRLAEIGSSTLALGLLVQVSLSAFSRQSRREILQRDGYECVSCGHDHNLEAAHTDHTRDDDYNNPDRGLTKCTGCHFDDHVAAIGNSEETNGLAEHHNLWAVGKLWERMPKWMKKSRELPEELVAEA